MHLHIFKKIFWPIEFTCPFYVNRLVIWQMVGRRNKKYSVSNSSKKSHILKRSEGGRRPTERSVFRCFSSCWQILVKKWWQNVSFWEIFKQCDSQLLSSIYYFIYIGQQLSSKPSDGQQAEGSSLLSFFSAVCLFLLGWAVSKTSIFFLPRLCTMMYL